MKKYLLPLICYVILFIGLTIICYANAAEPPSIIIIISNPPENLSIYLEGSRVEARMRKTAWEAQYTFYSQDLQGNGNYTLAITDGDNGYFYDIDIPVQSYRNVFTLNLKNRTLTPGILPARSIILVSLRVLFTLLIEGAVFWLFGFRGKRSWILFIILNLVTQGLLNVWLDSFALTQSYLIFSLIIGEFFVFLTEIAALAVLIKEHTVFRRICHAVVANIASLIAGGFLITLLPV